MNRTLSLTADKTKGILTVVGIILLEIVLARYLVQNWLTVLLLALFALIIVIFQFNRDFLYISLFAVMPFQNSVTVAGIHITLSDVLLVVLGAIILASHALSKRHLKQSPLSWPLLLYIAACVLSMVPAVSTGSIVELVQRIEFVVVAFLVFSFFSKAKVIFKGFYTFLFVEVFISLVVIQSFLSGQREGIFVLGMHKNGIGTFLAYSVVISFGLLYLRERENKSQVTLLRSLLFPLSVALILTLSRGSWLGAIVGVLTILLVGGSKRHFVQAFIVFAILFILASQFLPAEFLEQATTFAPEKSWSVKQRLVYLSNALVVFKEKPVLGIGVGNYLTGAGTPHATEDPHCLPLLILAETGVLGAATFLFILFAYFRTALRNHRSLRQNSLPQILNLICLGVVAAGLTHGTVDVFWARGTPLLVWISMGITASIWRSWQEKVESEIQTSSAPSLATKMNLKG